MRLGLVELYLKYTAKLVVNLVLCSGLHTHTANVPEPLRVHADC